MQLKDVTWPWITLSMLESTIRIRSGCVYKLDQNIEIAEVTKSNDVCFVLIPDMKNNICWVFGR